MSLPQPLELPDDPPHLPALLAALRIHLADLDDVDEHEPVPARVRRRHGPLARALAAYLAAHHPDEVERGLDR